MQLTKFSCLQYLLTAALWDGSYGGALIKSEVPKDTVFTMAAFSHVVNSSSQIQAESLGSWDNCGDTGFG
jgi:hypothetical protein